MVLLITLREGKQMTTIHTIQNGARVQGEYCGHPYQGTVTAQRPHTMNHRIQMFWVALDAPVDIFGLVRDSLIIHGSDSYEAALHFNGGTSADTIEQVA
jgi:hypothetical protein